MFTVAIAIYAQRILLIFYHYLQRGKHSIWLLLQLCLIIDEIIGSGSVDTQIRLYSTPENLTTVNPGQSFTFTCETTDSTIIAWSSEELVGKGQFQISFLSIEDPGFIQYCQAPNNASFANLTRVDEDSSGNRVLESRLHIINVSATYDTATVVCHNRAQGLNKSITFSIENIAPTDTDSSTTVRITQTTEQNNDSDQTSSLLSRDEIIIVIVVVVVVVVAVVVLLIVVGAIISAKKRKQKINDESVIDNEE